MIGPIETLLWMLAAVVKFVLTPSLMIGWGVNWGMTVATCSVGAAFGVYVFFYFGKWICIPVNRSQSNFRNKVCFYCCSLYGLSNEVKPAGKYSKNDCSFSVSHVYVSS